MKVVTGAFSYTGSYIARDLLDRGEEVRTLSRESPPSGHHLLGRVAFGRLQFEDERALEADLAGADTLFNTYWIRSPHGGRGFDAAIDNTRKLLAAAERAGVRRVVHLGVSNSSRSSLPYFRGKAEVDRALRACALPHAIVRPTLIFGHGDVLLSNIAWCLRRFPLFLIPGRGDYLLQPVAAEDVAQMAVEAGGRSSDEEFDAAGPVQLSFAKLVDLIKHAIGSRTPVLKVPPKVALAGATVVGRARRDTMLTAQELDGLMAGLLTSGQPPRGTRRLDAWLSENADTLGRRYVSERLRNWTAGSIAPVNPDFRISDDPAGAAATLLEEASGHVCITGGSTPKEAYERVARKRSDWSGVDFWFTDERCVAPDHEHSNFRMADEALLRAAEGATVHRMKGELGPVEGAADQEREYEAAGRPDFDLILLGMGPDAHICSLFPGDSALGERERPVTGIETPGMAPLVSRITFTLPVVNASRSIVFLVTGDDKAGAVARAFSGRRDPMAPASLVEGEVTVLLDEGAARRL